MLLKKYIYMKDLSYFKFNKIKKTVLKCLMTLDEKNKLLLVKKEKKNILLLKKQNKYIYADDKLTRYDIIEMYNRWKKYLFLNFRLFINTEGFNKINFNQNTLNYRELASNYITKLNILNKILCTENFKKIFFYYNLYFILKKQKINLIFLKNLNYIYIYLNKKIDYKFILNKYIFKFNNNSFFNINLSETLNECDDRNYIYIADKILVNNDRFIFTLGTDKFDLYHILNRDYKYYFKSFDMYNHIRDYIIKSNKISKKVKDNSFSWLLTWELEIPFFKKTNECYITLRNNFEKYNLNLSELNYLSLVKNRHSDPLSINNSKIFISKKKFFNFKQFCLIFYVFL